MNSKSILQLTAIGCLALVVSMTAPAQDVTASNTKDNANNKEMKQAKDHHAQGNIKDEVKQSEKAAKVFNEIMGTPDKEIPSDVLERAECVAVFPEVIK